jgi:pimeloyl-ACP methyl ester carboxylesterase
VPSFNKIQKRFLGQGATFQKENHQVKLKGKFLKARRPDMPTLIWLPEVMEPAENFESFFTHPKNSILDYRNVWLLNPRNFGDSDHHSSFALTDVAEDIKRFIDEKQLSIVTIGGHGYGAKIACVFGSNYLERTSGVMCVEGGPVDISYHAAWHETKKAINSAFNHSRSSTSLADFTRKLDKEVTHSKWNKIIKQNVAESSSGLSFKFNLEGLHKNVNKPYPDISSWSTLHGLFPGRAFVNFASESHHILLATNTIPFYKFFPKLEGRFPSSDFNFIQTDDSPLSKYLLLI